MKQKLSLKIFGEVQGINLRSMIKVKALDLQLVGFVRNSKDGTVAVEAEGQKEKLEELVSWINKSPGFSQVSGVEDHWSEASGQYHDFTIDYIE